MSTKGQEATKMDDALAEIRSQVEHQLGIERPPPAAIDPEGLVRFSASLPEHLSPDERHALVAGAEELDPWLQGPFLIGGDIVIGGTWRTDQRWEGLGEQVPTDLADQRILDVGSNAGYDAFMFNLRGAEYVLACEPSEFHRQAVFLNSIYKTPVDFQQIGWQELDPAVHGTFEVVHCNGLLYHELHPQLLLERLMAMTSDNGTLFFGSMMLEAVETSEYARFVPGEYFGDPSWWWVPGRLALRWMLEVAGFEVKGQFGTAPGPPGEFAVITSYFVATPAE